MQTVHSLKSSKKKKKTQKCAIFNLGFFVCYWSNLLKLLQQHREALIFQKYQWGFQSSWSQEDTDFLSPNPTAFYIKKSVVGNGLITPIMFEIFWRKLDNYSATSSSKSVFFYVVSNLTKSWFERPCINFCGKKMWIKWHILYVF